MATTEEQVILDIKMNYEDALFGILRYQEAIKSLQQANKDLEKNNEDLRKAFKDNNITYDEMTAKIQDNTLTIAANNEAIKENKAELRSASKELQNDMKVQKAANEDRADSLVALRAELSNLTKDYDKLSAEERKTAKGRDLAAAINKTTDEIKEAEAATQRYYRNVGNYENAIKDAIGANSKWFTGLQQISDVMKGGLTNAFKVATNSAKAFGTQLWALMKANPILTVLAAVAAVVVKLTSVMFSNEEQANRIKVLFAPIQRGLTALTNVLQNVAGWLLTLAEKTANFVGWLFKLAESLPLVGGGFKKFNNMMREGINLEKEEQQLVKDRRKNTEQDAKDRQRLAELDKKAAAQRVNDAKGYIKTMNERKKIVEEQAKRHEDIAKRELALADARAAQSKNDAATEDDLAQKRAAVADAQSEATRNTIRDARGLAMAENKLANQAADAANNIKDLQQKIKDTADAERDAIRAAEDALTELIENNVQRQKKAINTEYARRVEDLERQKAELKEKGTLSAAAEKAIDDNIVAQAKLRDKELAKIDEESNQAALERAEKRLALLLEATENDMLKQRELRLQQLEVQQQLDEQEITQQVQNEQEREEMLEAVRASYRAQRAEIERNFENDLIKKREDAIKQEFTDRINEAYGNEMEQERLRVQERLTLLEEAEQMEGETIEQFNSRKLQLQADYNAAKDALDKKELEAQVAKAQAIANLMGSLGDVFGELGEKNKAFAILQKTLALGEIAVNTGVALAQGIKQAQSVPFPANIAAIATTVATILANIATAIKTVNSAKFAEGGLIEGAGTGTSDSIVARVSNGESIMTANATGMFAPLLSSLNQLGGGVPIVAQPNPQQQIGEEYLAAAVARGMEMAPRPVVSVEEINSVGRRVEVIENIASV